MRRFKRTLPKTYIGPVRHSQDRAAVEGAFLGDEPRVAFDFRGIASGSG